MSVSNNIITAPVSFADVNAVLGTSHTDLATLCKDSHINMWAKYKPLHLSYYIGIPTEAMLKAVNYGLSMPSGVNAANFVSGIINNTTGGLNGWGYSKPSGGASSPYRLQDFNGYNHNAPPMVSSFSVKETIARGESGSCACIMPAPSADAVSLSDLSDPKYFGIVIMDLQIPKWCVSTATKGGTYIEFTIPVDFPLSGGTPFKVYPFLCNKQLTAGYCSNRQMPASADGENIYYWTLPNLNYTNLNIVSADAGSGVVVKAVWTSNNQIEVQVKNTGSRVFTNNYIDLYKDGVYNQRKTFSSLAATTTYTDTFSTGISTSSNYYVVVSLNQGGYTIRANVMRES